MTVSQRIFGLTLAIASALALLSFTLRPPAAAPQRMIRVTGVLDGWRLEAHGGTVYLRLKAEKAVEENGEGEPIPPEGMWFHTPPDRSDDLQLEQMALAILLTTELRSGGVPVIVTAKQERALDGTSPEKSLPLESIGRL